MSFDASTIETK